MEYICNFIPPKEHKGNINFYHFVYETSIKKLTQPFVHSDFYMHLVFKGTATLKIKDKEFNIKSGDIFFTFPHQKFTIDAQDDFTYLYISFNGQDVSTLLNSLGITRENSIYYGFQDIIEFWMQAIRRINRSNANTLTESVLMYTLSFIDNTTETNSGEINEKFDSILQYIDHNYTSKEMSIKRVADIFFYSEKYLSSLFVKKTGIKFTQYLNSLRINYAMKLIKENNCNIADISFKCGYSEQFYFSKVFKKITGKTPSEYIKASGK